LIGESHSWGENNVGTGRAGNGWKQPDSPLDYSACRSGNSKQTGLDAKAEAPLQAGGRWFEPGTAHLKIP
jgi:hypothetical protein